MSKSLPGRLRPFGLSDLGQKRILNEDSFHCDERLLLVADGMGGHAAGEVASREAIACITAFLKPFRFHDDPERTEVVHPQEDDDSTLEDLPNPAIEDASAAVQKANEAICALNQERGYPEGQGMGTTIVGLWLPGYTDDAVVFNVGDSRLYLFRDGRLTQLTRDHTWYQYWLDNGQIGPAPSSNIVMRALGIAHNMPVDAHIEKLCSGDLILLCSDGLTAMVADPVIEEILGKTVFYGLQETCRKLVYLSNENGGKDNITVILARYE